VSSDFELTLEVNGKPVESAGWTWLPHGMMNRGNIDSLGLSCDAYLLWKERTCLLTIGRDAGVAQDPVTLMGALHGTLDTNRVWEFARPTSATPTTPRLVDSCLALEQGETAIAIDVDAPDLHWDMDAARWTCALPAGASRVRVAISIGPRDEALAACKQALADSEARAKSEAAYTEDMRRLLSRVPRFKNDNQDLETLYYRSLVHALTNRWEVREFVLNPYYSTGSVNGGCLCNYLWNFGECWEILPLIDPEATKTHIKQFLSVDLTKHFAFLPVTGEGFGPWYMVNQEKIIGLVHYYVETTGDTAFLSESVNDKTILDWVVYHALVGDDLAKPVALIDYGPSNSHLELRKQYAYNHVMPDLNGRRYNNYVFAARLSERVGRPRPDLLDRAEQLKRVLHEQLWDAQAKWFAFVNEKGEKELRYTCQMFKLFNSGVLTPESEAGLLSHLSEREFLGAYGLHSLSKLDPAYDEADIDNGGPGACTCFPPQIAERLYKSGHRAEADNLIRRILWWGQRMPYWGDSLVASRPDYRRDTPLQCTIDGLAVAQCLLFGREGYAPD
jgi:hypothetical protein